MAEEAEVGGAVGGGRSRRKAVGRVLPVVKEHGMICRHLATAFGPAQECRSGPGLLNDQNAWAAPQAIVKKVVRATVCLVGGMVNDRQCGIREHITKC